MANLSCPLFPFLELEEEGKGHDHAAWGGELELPTVELEASG